MTTPPQIWSADKMIQSAGNFSAVSKWITIDQNRINQFADATDDHQFIHVDEFRAKNETAFGGTIAHGFLSLSLLSTMIESSFPKVENSALSINYGFEKIRFLAPVPAGSRVRAKIDLVECSPRKPGELISRYDVTVEIENNEKPALVAQWLGLTILKQDKKHDD